MAEYNFTEIIEDIILRKQQWAKLTFCKKDTVEEKPRDVYLNVCQKIAEFFEPYGFKYARSKQTMTLKRKDLGMHFRISFYSSHYNSAGTNVALEVYATVSSPDFKKWTEEQWLNKRRNEYYGFIGTGQIGYLQEPGHYFRWNVADPETRDQEIQDIIDHINKFAISYFQQFENIPAIVSRLETQGEFPGMCNSSIIDVAEFLLYYSSKESVKKAFSAFLNSREAWDKYEKYMELFENEQELQDSTYWGGLAYLTHVLDLKLQK